MNTESLVITLDSLIEVAVDNKTSKLKKEINELKEHCERQEHNLDQLATDHFKELIRCFEFEYADFIEALRQVSTCDVDFDDWNTEYGDIYAAINLSGKVEGSLEIYLKIQKQDLKEMDTYMSLIKVERDIKKNQKKLQKLRGKINTIRTRAQGKIKNELIKTFYKTNVDISEVSKSIQRMLAESE